MMIRRKEAIRDEAGYYYPAFVEASEKTLRASVAANGFWHDHGADTLHRCAV